MKLTLKTLKQTTFVVEVETSDTVRAVKAKVEAAKGEEFYADGLKLIFSGKILVDDQTIGEYNIKETDFVVVMPGKPRAKPAPVPATPATPATTTASAVPATPLAPARPTTQNSATTGVTSPTGTSNTASTVPNQTFSEEIISRIMDLGFQREDTVAALRAAFGNVDRAVEYLMAGEIPNAEEATAGSEEQNQSQEQGEEEGQELPAPLTPSSPLFFLLNNPQFTQLRTLIQQQPQLLPAILSQLGQNNPELVQLINANRDDFFSLLNTPVDPTNQQQQRGAQIQVTPTERAAIERLTAMGFDRNIVIQAYFACDKNEELTANYLLEHGFE